MSSSERYPPPRPASDAVNDAEPFDPLFFDPVVEAYKKDVDVSLLDRTLRMTVAERAQSLVNSANFIRKFRPVVQALSVKK